MRAPGRCEEKLKAAAASPPSKKRGPLSDESAEETQSGNRNCDVCGRKGRTIHAHCRERALRQGGVGGVLHHITRQAGDAVAGRSAVLALGNPARGTSGGGVVETGLTGDARVGHARGAVAVTCRADAQDSRGDGDKRRNAAQA